MQTAYRLKIKGVATPSRLRAALAAVALERAFGNQIKAGLVGQDRAVGQGGTSIGRASFARKPRDFGTDARLIAALAAEHVGPSRPISQRCGCAVLRRFLDGADKAASSARARRQRPPTRPPPVEPAPPAPSRARSARPCRLRAEVRRHAAAHAQGWPGNRKAYISHVWRALREQRPDWGLSEIEFKCMLIEAHRAGSLALANADLKETRTSQDVQESAVVYKNAVFHFIRVDG